MRISTGAQNGGSSAAPPVECAQLTGAVPAYSDESGHSTPTPQPTELTRTTEQLLALLSRSRPRRSTMADQTVSRVIRLSPLRAEKGPNAAVLRVARGLLGAEELRAQRRVLAEIASHPGLDDECRQLLPRTLAFHERTDAVVSVESYRPGVDLDEVLARHPNRIEELTAAALSAIAPLHRATARLVVVDNVRVLGNASSNR